MQNKLEGPKTELADLLAGKIRRKSGNKGYISVTSKSIGGERGQRAQFWSQKAEILARDMKWHLFFRFKRATPSDPPKGSPGGGQGSIPQIIMCYVNFGVFNSGKSKNDLYFHIRVTPTPARAPSGGGLGGLKTSSLFFSRDGGIFIQFFV